MDTSSILMAAFGGFIAGTVLFGATVRWAGSIHELRRTGNSPGVIVGFGLFHSGLWVLIAFAVFTYFTYSKGWWPWFMSGLAVSFAVFSVAAVVAFRGARQARQARTPEQ